MYVCNASARVPGLMPVPLSLFGSGRKPFSRVVADRSELTSATSGSPWKKARTFWFASDSALKSELERVKETPEPCPLNPPAALAEMPGEGRSLTRDRRATR